MKEPKYQKLEENQNENEKYDFFQKGILPEKEDIKKLKNKSSKKDGKRLVFSLPVELEQKKPPSTQNDDDLLPFFAKDYPNSNEEKEEMYSINTPIPSETSNTGGEAEEVEGIEEEENQNSIEKNQNFKNDDIKKLDLGQSFDFNSDLEAEQELEKERKKEKRRGRKKKNRRKEKKINY